MRFQKALKAFQDTRHLLNSAKEAGADNLIDEAEALDLVQDAFALVRTVVGKVALSESAKALLRASAKQLLQVLGDA